MTVCERIQDDLKAYLDGELFWPVRWSVRRHVAGCAGCRQELSEMEALQVRLRAADTGELPAELRARILAAIPDIASGERRRAGTRLRPNYAWGVAFGAVLLMLIAGPAVLNRWGHAPALESLAKSASPGAANEARSEAPFPKAAGKSNKSPVGASGGSASATDYSASPPVGAMKSKGSAASAAPPVFANGSPAYLAAPEAKPAVTVNSAAELAKRSDGAQGLPNQLAREPGNRTEGPGRVQLADGLREKPVTLQAAIPNPAPVGGGGKGLAQKDNGAASTRRTAPLTDLATAGILSASPPIELTLLVDNVAQRRSNILALAKDVDKNTDQYMAYRSLDASAAEVTFDVPVIRLKETIGQIQAQGDIVVKASPEAESLLRRMNIAAKQSQEGIDRGGQGNSVVIGESLATDVRGGRGTDKHALKSEVNRSAGNRILGAGVEQKVVTDQFDALRHNDRQANAKKGAMLGVQSKAAGNFGFNGSGAGGGQTSFGGGQAGGYGRGGAGGPEPQQSPRGGAGSAPTGQNSARFAAKKNDDLNVATSKPKPAETTGKNMESFSLNPASPTEKAPALQNQLEKDRAKLHALAEAQKQALPPAYWFLYSSETRGVEKLSQYARVTVKFRLKQPAPPAAGSKKP